MWLALYPLVGAGIFIGMWKVGAIDTDHPFTFKIVSGGTDTHLVLVDVFSKGVRGKEAEHTLDEAYMTVNKNAIPFDPASPFVTSGVRLGTPAGTTRGFGVAEFKQIGELIGDGAHPAIAEVLLHFDDDVHRLAGGRLLGDDAHGVVDRRERALEFDVHHGTNHLNDLADVLSVHICSTLPWSVTSQRASGTPQPPAPSP